MSIPGLKTSTQPSAELFVPDLRGKICEFLTEEEISTMAKTCRAWLETSIKIEREHLQKYVSEEGFGARKWEQYFGTVDKVPLPLELWKILNSPCPFWSDRPDHKNFVNRKGLKVRDTHILFFMPKTVSGEPMTLNQIEALSNKHGGSITYASNHHKSSDTAKSTYGNKKYPHSYWVIMLKTKIFSMHSYGHNPRFFLSETEQASTQFLSQKFGYHHPRILETTVNLVTHIAANKNRPDFDDLFTSANDHQVTPVICKETEWFLPISYPEVPHVVALIEAREEPATTSICIGNVHSFDKEPCIRPCKRFYGPDHPSSSSFCVIS